MNSARPIEDKAGAPGTGTAIAALGSQHVTAWHACGISTSTSASQSLRRTVADKRHAVQMMLDDTEAAKMGDREIARHCGVSHTFVGALRNPKPVEPPASAPSKARVPQPPATGGSTAGAVGGSGNVATPPRATAPKPAAPPASPAGPSEVGRARQRADSSQFQRSRKAGAAKSCAGSSATAAQRDRMVEMLRIGEKTTFDFRRAGIMQSSTRIFELRALGYSITTTRRDLFDADWYRHKRVAVYALVGEPDVAGAALAGTAD